MLGAIALLLLAWDAAGWDLTVSHVFGNASGFRAHEAPLAVALHNTGRRLSAAVVIALIANLVRPFPFACGLTFRERLVWLFGTVSALLAVSMLKRFSLTSCPWSLAEFGGDAVWISHWRAWLPFGAGDGGSGHCFPSGHASSAFAMWAGFVALRDRHPRAAKVWAFATLVAGALFSALQIARGAHFLSHALWAAWVCAVVAHVTAGCLARKEAVSPSAQALSRRVSPHGTEFSTGDG